jgi:phenylalanyl-tRNA synthetase alpha chain
MGGADHGNLRDEIASADAAAGAALKAASGSESIRSVAAAHRRSLAALKSRLGGVTDLDARKECGRLLSEVVARIERDAEALLAVASVSERAATVAAESMDLSEHMQQALLGTTHIVSQALDRLVDVFVGLGFVVAEGPEIETDFHNFEALNMPASHPARSEFDTLFLEPANDLQRSSPILLRTHTSPVQIRVMQSVAPPIYAVMPGRVFRRDTPDATHMPVFHQIEGLVVDRGITFADLAGTIEAFTKAFFGEDFTSRLRPSYFPFTEPSAEFDVRGRDGKWIELGGCGMVHPDVLRAGGVDPEEFTGFAFGFGIDRMAKERHSVADIREMYTNDLRFLRQFR